MVYHERRRESLINGVAILALTTIIGLFGYAGDKAYTGILSAVSDVRNSLVGIKDEQRISMERLWNRMDEKEKRLNCLAESIKGCCANAQNC